MTIDRDIRAGVRWYVARTTERRLGEEAKPEARFPGTGLRRIAAEIRALGFEVMIPTEYVRTRGPKRTRIYAQVPVYREYIFVCFDCREPGWPEIRRVDGVHCLMPRFAELPYPVPKGLAEEIDRQWAEERRLHEATLDGVLRRSKVPMFAPGAKVKIKAPSEYNGEPVWIADEATVKSATHDRVRVLLSMLGREVEADVDGAQVVPVEAA